MRDYAILVCTELELTEIRDPNKFERFMANKRQKQELNRNSAEFY